MNGSDERDWFVFGYGSLVSLASLGRTLQRQPVLGVDVFAATLDGYQRRWNYAISKARGRDRAGRLWTLIALGLAVDATARVNGVVARVSVEELEHLDRRESRYDRVDVTQLIDADAALGIDASVVTYVPRPAAIAAMQAAGEARQAAIERRYWDLVLDAFDNLGQRDEFLATTPASEFPILELERV